MGLPQQAKNVHDKLKGNSEGSSAPTANIE
jgi:hypothetical protein